MKAISKSYGNFEVRFSTPSMFNLERLSTYDSFENSGLVNAEINFKGVWYPVTLEYKMLNKDCRIPVAVLSKKAADAFGVEYDFNREPAIMLDKDYKSFIEGQVEAARAKANTCDFSQVHIATYCDIVSIYGWDADEQAVNVINDIINIVTDFIELTPDDDEEFTDACERLGLDPEANDVKRVLSYPPTISAPGMLICMSEDWEIA